MQAKQHAATGAPAILTPEEVANLFRVELSWIYEKSRQRQRNPLPCHRIGRYLRFRLDEVMAWFDAQARPSTRKGVARG